MANDTKQARENYIAAIQKRLESAEYFERNGERITALRPSELQALNSVFDQMQSTGAPKKFDTVAIQLEPDARKHFFIYFCVLPLMEAGIQGNVLYVASNGDSEATAKMAFINLTVLSKRVEFTTLGDLAQPFDYGRAKQILNGRWIICDMKTAQGYEMAKASPLDEARARINRTYNAIAFSPVCNKFFIAQKGEAAIGPFPPQTGARSGCFIATAACGSPDAWQVDTLRAFRDDVMLPTKIGRAANATYCHLSPPLADWIADRPLARKLVRNFFITPVARVLSIKAR